MAGATMMNEPTLAEYRAGLLASAKRDPMPGAELAAYRERWRREAVRRADQFKAGMDRRAAKRQAIIDQLGAIVGDGL